MMSLSLLLLLLFLSLILYFTAALQVTVVGGTGFVGSRVCKLLATDGGAVQVTSVSKSGKTPAWCNDESWTDQVVWKKADLNDDGALDAAIGKPEVIVSCVGVVGTDREELLKGNGDINVAAFQSAKRGGKVKKCVYVSVASEVAACKDGWLPEFFTGYFDGKVMAEEAALDVVDGDTTRVCFVKPTFIYGGNSFGLFPPRVNYEYGSFVEELLTLTPFQLLADKTPGLIKVALRPPVSVDAVAAACASAALGETNGILDGTKAIKAATDQPPATGLTDALAWSKVQLTKAYEWGKVEIPKAVEWTKEKIDETKK